MKIKLLAIGKTDHKQLSLLIDEYQNRLKHYIKFEIETKGSCSKVKQHSLQHKRQGKRIIVDSDDDDNETYNPLLICKKYLAGY